MSEIVCKQCGVELDDGMEICPLCANVIASDVRTSARKHHAKEEKSPAALRHVMWQIVCVLLLSGIVASLAINVSKAGDVTWSVYPVTICLIMLSYAVLMAFWRVSLLVQMLIGLILSSALLVAIGLFTAEDWPINLALPMLAAVNVICMLMIWIVNKVEVKGLNVVAIVFVAVAVLCIAIDSIISRYFEDQIALSWSVIVAACLLPVTAAIVFMYFRTRNNSHLQKIFHT